MCSALKLRTAVRLDAHAPTRRPATCAQTTVIFGRLLTSSRDRGRGPAKLLTDEFSPAGDLFAPCSSLPGAILLSLEPLAEAPERSRAGRRERTTAPSKLGYPARRSAPRRATCPCAPLGRRHIARHIREPICSCTLIFAGKTQRSAGWYVAPLSTSATLCTLCQIVRASPRLR